MYDILDIYEENERPDETPRQRAIRMDQENATRRVLATHDGRLFLRMLMDTMGVANYFGDVHQTLVEVGQQRAAMFVKQWVLQCDPEMLILMEREALDRARHYDTLEND